MQLFQSISMRFLMICAVLRHFVPHLERLLIFHTQEVTGSSPAVSTKKKPWKPCVSKVFPVFDEFSVSAYDGHFVGLCFQMLPCFRSQAVLSCTAFVP